jgi:valyl-tRNA synthetase
MGDARTPVQPRSLADRWILSRLAHLTKKTTERLATFHVAEAGEGLYNFLWHEFADWYVEIAKTEKNIPLLRYVFKQLLVLLHPFAPFVTEELWGSVAGGKSLCMIESWPKPGKRFGKEEKTFLKLQTIIVAVRTIRNITKTPHNAKLQITAAGTFTKTLLDQQTVIGSLASVKSIARGKIKSPTIVIPGCALDLHLGDAATHLLQQEIERLKGHETRLRELLKKPSFKARAPKEVVAQNQQKLDDIVDQLKHLGA